MGQQFAVHQREKTADTVNIFLPWDVNNVRRQIQVKFWIDLALLLDATDKE